MKYKVIKTKTQYKEYCTKLEGMLHPGSRSKTIGEEIDLLTVLIEKWDEEHNTFADSDPVEILKSLMKEQEIKSVDIAKLLGVSEGLVSDILHYKKGLSKETIRILSVKFKIDQEAFNRPYKLKVSANSHLRNASVMNTTKALVVSRR